MSKVVFLSLSYADDEFEVSYGGTHKELTDMMVRIARHDEDLKIIFHAAGAALNMLDGMDDVQNQINNL